MGCESGGVLDEFLKIIDRVPTKHAEHHNILKTSLLGTPLGIMLAIADNEELYLLEFFDSSGLKGRIERLCIRTKSVIIQGSTKPITSIEAELKSYFAGRLKTFKTPIHLVGSPFQKEVWSELMRLPYGAIRSYKEQASALNNNKAYRAVANANSANKCAIVIPCHRIINSNGSIGGYRGGFERKKWLIEHESQ